MTNEEFDLMDRRPENELSTNKPQQAEELFTLDDLIADILDGFTPDSEPKSCIPPEPQITHSGKVYGIDLGGGYSCIAQISESGLPVIIEDGEYAANSIPSAIYFEDKDTFCTGFEAMNWAEDIETASQALFRGWKKWMGREEEPGAPVYEAFGRRYTPAELTAILLKKIVNYAEISTCDCVNNVVLTCPVWYGNDQVRLLYQAGRMAGLNILAILNEPVAAAIYHFSQDSESSGKRVLVCDLGVSGFDTAILELKREGGASMCRVIAMDGSSQPSCPEWDSCLYELLLEKFCEECGAHPESAGPDLCHEIRTRTEHIRKQLSARENVRCRFTYEDMKIRLEVTRAEFENAARHLTEQMICRTEQALANANLTADDIDEVLCVGGGVKTPMVFGAFTERFGEKAILWEPEFAVAKGAAIYGRNTAGYRFEKSDPLAGANEDITV